jgi:hypothetical protein
VGVAAGVCADEEVSEATNPIAASINTFDRIKRPPSQKSINGAIRRQPGSELSVIDQKRRRPRISALYMGVEQQAVDSRNPVRPRAIWFNVPSSISSAPLRLLILCVRDR